MYNTKNRGIGLAEKRSILLFSGGRDSTLAALRLFQQYHSITLLTFSTERLDGLSNVYKRYEELRRHIKFDAYVLRLSGENPRSIQFADSCLNCQANYISAAISTMKQLSIRILAMGFTRYQAYLPEQNKTATRLLGKEVFSKRGIRMILPVYRFTSKEQIDLELNKYSGISKESLEQKCKVKTKGFSDHPDISRDEYQRWVNHINLLAESDIKLSLVDHLEWL